jgi:hypothetical protein
MLVIQNCTKTMILYYSEESITFVDARRRKNQPSELIITVHRSSNRAIAIYCSVHSCVKRGEPVPVATAHTFTDGIKDHKL